MKPGNKNSFKSLTTISINNNNYCYYSLSLAEKNGLEGISKLPKSLKVLLENLLRYEDDKSVLKSQILALRAWLKNKKSDTEIAYRPARVLLQDYTGIPAVADLAAMREAVKEKNKDPKKINPLSSVDLVIDHSVQVDKYSKLTWWQIPVPGGTILKLLKACWPHFKKEYLSPFLANSISTFFSNESGFADLSTCTEWSITKSTEDRGLIVFGSLFFSLTASLIAARSATAGIPV